MAKVVTAKPSGLPGKRNPHQVGQQTWYEWTGGFFDREKRAWWLAIIALVYAVGASVWAFNVALQKAQLQYEIVHVDQNYRAVDVVPVTRKPLEDRDAVRGAIGYWMKYAFRVDGDPIVAANEEKWSKSKVVKETPGRSFIDSWYAQHDPIKLGADHTVLLKNITVRDTVSANTFDISATVQEFDKSGNLDSETPYAGEVHVRVVPPTTTAELQDWYTGTYFDNITWAPDRAVQAQVSTDSSQGVATPQPTDGPNDLQP